MRVLLTGFTIRQCGEDQNVNQYATIFRMLPAALRLAGHEVDQRSVTPGEDLRGRYDVALIGVHPMASMASSRKFGACWAAVQLPHVVMLQDWKVKLTVDHLKTQNYMWKSSHLQGKMLQSFELAAPYATVMDRVRARWSRVIDSVILPMYGWADPGQFTRLAPHVTRPEAWDVSPWLPEFGRPVDMSDKHDSWVLASLSNQDRWLASLDPQPRWPVVKIFKPEEDNKVQIRDAFVEEATLVREVYSERAGVMMPCYGSECLVGWWRSRPQFAAQAGSVLYADESDVSQFGQGYWQPLRAIEEMRTDELVDLASHQAELTQRWVVDRATSARRLGGLLESCAQPAVSPTTEPRATVAGS